MASDQMVTQRNVESFPKPIETRLDSRFETRLEIRRRPERIRSTETVVTVVRYPTTQYGKDPCFAR